MSGNVRFDGRHFVRSVFGGSDHPRLAAGLMIFALALLSLQDAIIKLTSSDVSIWQFQFLRSSFNLIILFGSVAVFGGIRSIPPKNIGAVALRSLFLVGAMLCFFSGVPFLTLSEISAGLYLFPLIVTLLSRFVLGERVDGLRMAAVGAGFCGSMLILRPGAQSFEWVSVLPICAAFFYACMVLTTRKLCREEAPTTLACGTAVAFLLIGAAGLIVMPAPEAAMAANSASTLWPYLLTGWHELTTITLLAVVACSALNLAANICLARAYQTAESSWLAPYDYSYLVFAAFWGFMIWGTVPELLTVVGMVIIAAAGIFVATRNAQALPSSS
jgi:drug/metabolite transporter (DMT)-like permease